MSDVTSLEKSKELFDLSKWSHSKVESHSWYFDEKLISGFGELKLYAKESLVPAYPLGYLLRKLPKLFDNYFFDLSVTADGTWVAEYFTNDYTPERPISKYKFEADTPEDAVCGTVIALIKQDVITEGALNV